MPDLLDLTARQVRMDYKGSAVHKLVRAEQQPDGRVYRAHCGAILAAHSGALLTTRAVTCCCCPPPAATCTCPGAR